MKEANKHSTKEEIRDRRMRDQISWRRAKNDKYFGYFDTKQAAWECLKEFASRYRYGHKNTIDSLCEEYQDKGIFIYPTHASRWLTDIFNINIRHPGYTIDVEKNKVHFFMDSDVDDIRRALKDAVNSRYLVNRYINAWLRVLFNLPIEEIFVFLYDEHGLTTVGFFEHNGEIRAIYHGKVSESTKKLLEVLCAECEDNGYSYIKQRVQALSWFCVGADKQKED